MVDKNIRYFFIIAMCVFTSLCVFGQTKRGLVIGLGQYQDRTWGTVHGDKDVPLVKNMLTSCGYKYVATLVNKEATKAGILTAFGNLSKRCQKGDIVYIHFLGHGQQITDVNGDEEDGWDEAWIPYDAMYAYSKTYKGEKHLIDDEIAVLLTDIRMRIGTSGKLLVVVDACHSGDSDRGTEAEDEYIRGASDNFVIPISAKPKRTMKAKENWLTLTACKNIQDNCEVKSADGNFYGMLSYVLSSRFNNWNKLDNNTILSDIQSQVNLNRKRRKQTVTLSGNHSLTQFFK